MTKNEILIGREVGKDDFPVDEKYKSVGRKHARIYRNQDSIYIEDLDTANGTFVNGKIIKVKKITASDRVFLGGLDYFELKLEKALALLPMSDSDFKNGFLRLKEVYDDYQKEKNILEGKGQADLITKRMLPTMLMGTITGIVTAIVPPDTRAIIGIIGGVLTIVVFLVATKLATASGLKMKEELNQLKEAFELNFVCPACRASLGAKSWEFYKKQSKCPGCKREWGV